MAAAETGRLTPMENKKVYFEFLRSVLNVRWRKFESLIKKICNRKWAVVFNRACLKEELIPNYCRNIYIYIYCLEIFLSCVNKLYLFYDF